MVFSYTQEEQVWQKSHLGASQEAGQCYNTSRQHSYIRGRLKDQVAKMFQQSNCGTQTDKQPSSEVPTLAVETATPGRQCRVLAPKQEWT